MRRGRRKTVRQRAAAAVYISVGVFFIKMLWEEVTSPASVFITAEMEAEALCQGECKVVWAERAFRVPERALGQLAVSVSASTAVQRLSPLAGGGWGRGPLRPPALPTLLGAEPAPCLLPWSPRSASLHPLCRFGFWTAWLLSRLPCMRS